MITSKSNKASLRKRIVGAFVVGTLVVSGLPAPALADALSNGAMVEDIEVVTQPDAQQPSDDIVVQMQDEEGQGLALDVQGGTELADLLLQGSLDADAYAAIKQVLDLGDISLSDEAIVKTASEAYETLPQDQKQLIDMLIPKISEYIAWIKAQIEELKKPAQTISACDKTVAIGKTVKLDAQNFGDGVLTYESSDKAVVTVSADGVVEPVSVGMAKIIITASSTNTYRKTVKKVNVTVSKGKQTVTATDKKVLVNKTVKLNAKTSADGKLTYKSSNKAIATVNSKGVVTGKKAGNVIITITAAETASYKKAVKQVIVSVSKAANTLAAKAKSATIKASAAKLAKNAVTLASNVVATKAVGKLTYANASIDGTAKKFGVNAKTGKLTVPKGTKKGTYQVRVKVTAAGDVAFLKGAKTVSYKVQVQ